MARRLIIAAAALAGIAGISVLALRSVANTRSNNVAEAALGSSSGDVETANDDQGAPAHRSGVLKPGEESWQSRECWRRINSVPISQMQEVGDACSRELSWRAAYTALTGMEVISPQEAAGWWSHRPLLRWLGSGRDELMFAWSSPDGTRDPAIDTASLDILYQVPPTTQSEDDFLGIVSKGGIWVIHRHGPRDTPIPFSDDVKHERVVVRAREARLIEVEGADWRSVRWEEMLPNGGWLQWEISNSVSLYTREETLALIDGLVADP